MLSVFSCAEHLINLPYKCFTFAKSRENDFLAGQPFIQQNAHVLFVIVVSYSYSIYRALVIALFPKNLGDLARCGHPVFEPFLCAFIEDTNSHKNTQNNKVNPTPTLKKKKKLVEIDLQ